MNNSTGHLSAFSYSLKFHHKEIVYAIVTGEHIIILRDTISIMREINAKSSLATNKSIRRSLTFELDKFLVFKRIDISSSFYFFEVYMLHSNKTVIYVSIDTNRIHSELTKSCLIEVYTSFRK